MGRNHFFCLTFVLICACLAKCSEIIHASQPDHIRYFSPESTTSRSSRSCRQADRRWYIDLSFRAFWKLSRWVRQSLRKRRVYRSDARLCRPILHLDLFESALLCLDVNVEWLTSSGLWERAATRWPRRVGGFDSR